MRLEQWSCLLEPSSVDIRSRMRLRGRLDDGRWVTTSAVIEVCGNIITTKSGLTYELGEPQPEYVEYCIAVGGYVPIPGKPIKYQP